MFTLLMNPLPQSKSILQLIPWKDDKMEMMINIDRKQKLRQNDLNKFITISKSESKSCKK